MEIFSRFMPSFLIIAFAYFSVLVIKKLLSSKQISHTVMKYRYTVKRYFMTKKEHEFFNILNMVLGSNYYVFPQVHLSSFLGHETKGQNWKGALSHIQRKSVDYMICDKENISPVLAVELDDKTHQHKDRRLRDIEVERIFNEAGLPFVRIAVEDMHNKNLVERKIFEAMGEI